MNHHANIVRSHAEESERQLSLDRLVGVWVAPQVAVEYDIPVTSLVTDCGMLPVDIKALRQSRDVAGARN